MKVIFTKRFPFGKFKAITLFGRLYVKDTYGTIKKDMILYPTFYFSLIQHERTHAIQERHLLYLFFYIWYVVEWVFKVFTEGRAYRRLSFEREARANERCIDRYNVFVNSTDDRCNNTQLYFVHVDGDKTIYNVQNLLIKNLDSIKSLEFKPSNIRGTLINTKWGSWCKYIFKRS